VRVIDETGEQIGILPFESALEMARQRGLDLIEVAPKAHPPVCRILEYGKFKYQQEKRRRKTQKKHSSNVLKEVRLTYKIGEHDFLIKVKSIRRFLEEGHRVKVSLRFKGREMVFAERGRKILERVAGETEDIAKVESFPKDEKRVMELYLIPKKVHQN
ncbi:MAG TPA: translation initiation factor IF-3, partial [Candidatus Aerophobetes bacterium]|nr:translation initiation factor IF-3 [Candidatus Aerophobetes bacterium]